MAKTLQILWVNPFGGKMITTQSTAQKENSGLVHREFPGEAKITTSKLKEFWEATRVAGKKEDAQNWKQRLKSMFWDFNKGRIRGFFRGLMDNIQKLSNPRAIFHQSSYKNLFEDIENIDDEVLEVGIQYMESDWEKRGEISSELALRGALTFVKALVMAKNLGSGLRFAVGKF